MRLVLVACVEALGDADSALGPAKRGAEVWRQERLIERSAERLGKNNGMAVCLSVNAPETTKVTEPLVSREFRDSSPEAVLPER